ncbi:jg5046 [Pararge aegeria aegeria]|uniref:Jg5046 protein n=1 Tax=Pararge aegeria aegeria TaxID=348720 RepID=A0A8S4SJ30_9NEOP|nr:jg5046 [Pararge aegeria aegeria]
MSTSSSDSKLENSPPDINNRSIQNIHIPKPIVGAAYYSREHGDARSRTDGGDNSAATPTRTKGPRRSALAANECRVQWRALPMAAMSAPDQKMLLTAPSRYASLPLHPGVWKLVVIDPRAPKLSCQSAPDLFSLGAAVPSNTERESASVFALTLVHYNTRNCLPWPNCHLKVVCRQQMLWSCDRPVMKNTPVQQPYDLISSHIKDAHVSNALEPSITLLQDGCEEWTIVKDLRVGQNHQAA